MVMYSWCLLVVEYMARKSSGPIWEEEKEEEKDEDNDDHDDDNNEERKSR